MDKYIMREILLVDDEGSFRKALAILLRKDGYSVDEVISGEEAISKLNHKSYDAVVADLMMRGKSGIDVLEEVKSKNPETEVIILTAYGTIPSAVEAVKKGATDYLTKPCKSETLLSLIKKTLERKRLLSEVESLQEVEKEKSVLKEIVFQSEAMKKIMDLIRKIAKTDITVLLEGESGTGKELLSRAIHNLSLRANKPFVAINCSGLPETLLESELFGYVKGAFTGALADKKGLFEEANSGTVFLDEICDASLTLQTRFLRAIQEQEIRKVGDQKFIKINTRIVAATNRDLWLLVKEGEFREDLYYRLNVMPIYIPPLRERKEDIAVLANCFVGRYSKKLGKEMRRLKDETIEMLVGYDWPGNVRELENTIERGVALTPTDELTTSGLLFLPENKGAWGEISLKEQTSNLKEKEREYILEVLEENGWNYSKASARLGIGRTTLWRKLKEFSEGLRQKEDLPPAEKRR
jgi:two-component system response regulator HydG